MSSPEDDGRAAFARQFGIGKHEVLPYLRDRFGDGFASAALSATGGAWSPDSPLTLRERSLVVLAALIAQGGVERRIRPHVRMALEHGATRDELEAVATFLAVYAGYPRASVGLEAIREELDRLGR